ncbi:metabotropic glutamate receptor 2 [Biomphalaria glabrata]|nr:metabotropic glutamate receptor 2 [Biomphalaria glabrata]
MIINHVIAYRLLCTALSVALTQAYFVVPKMTDKLYIKKGDVNIGVILSMTDYDASKTCGDMVSSFLPIELTESIAFALDRINSEKTVLPQLSLGFVMTDACKKETVAALQALRFTPNSNTEDYLDTNITTYLQSFKVVAVIGTDESTTTMPAAQVLNTGKIPLMAFYAFDNRLSDFSYYPNFMSVSAPETFMIHAALKYLAYKQWYYLNLIHDESAVSENLLREMSKMVDFNKFCIDTQVKVTSDTNVTKLVQFFVKNDNSSKVMFVIADAPVLKRISDAIKKTDSTGKLLWIGLEKWTNFMSSPDGIKGSIGIHFFSYIPAGFAEHVQHLDNSSANPWLVPLFRTKYNCNDAICIRRFIKLNHGMPSALSSQTYLATYMVAQAIALHLSIYCPRFTAKNAEDCLLSNIDTFPKTIRNISLRGYDHYVRINERGFLEDSYLVYQKSNKDKDPLRPVTTISIEDDSLSTLGELDWATYQFRFEILNPTYFCMPQCAYNEYRYTISKCCWSCRQCQDNEKVSDISQVCEQCPVLYWPQEINGHSVCVFIPPNYYRWNNPVAALLIGLAMGGIVICIVIFLLYFNHRAHPVIRAASIELSCVQLASCILGYCAVPIFLMKPTDIACKIALFLFRFSCNILFLTMLIKAVRVYRIFKLSKKNKKITYAGSKFLLIICVGHLILEAAELYITNMFYPLTVEITQPEMKVNYTELSCKFQKAHLLPFFIFDFFLLIMCSLFAFKTQTLPKNFRESRFVSMCIITTLILWIAFMPAYMTLISNNAKTLLLVCAVLINQTNLIIFIFITRLVAWKYHTAHRKSVFLTTIS